MVEPEIKGIGHRFSMNKVAQFDRSGLRASPVLPASASASGNRNGPLSGMRWQTQGRAPTHHPASEPCRRKVGINYSYTVILLTLLDSTRTGCPS